MDKYQDEAEREHMIEEILLSGQDPVSKVRAIIALDIDEETANDLVDRYQLGQMAPVYYESLDFADTDYEDDEVV